ncbi:MAG: hypothetical protein IJN48_03295 [Clostridia bacterium]|nr:hypothetical protein [Clostridia bacterium]
MKKTKAVLIGILLLLFYYFILLLMLLWEYNEKYSIIQNAMLYVLPALPGVALAALLIRNTLRDYLSHGVFVFFQLYACAFYGPFYELT